MEIEEKKIKKLFLEKEQEARRSGYFLNPDKEFTNQLLESLLINEERYGYQSCPCRLSVGKRQEDIDIICPCDYRDDDIYDYGNCYCGLYVNQEVAEGKKQTQPVPERRDQEKVRPGGKIKGAYPVYRCRVCGYLCARNKPPAKCPICKAAQDRFEIF